MSSMQHKLIVSAVVGGAAYFGLPAMIGGYASGQSSNVQAALGGFVVTLGALYIVEAIGV